MSKLFSIVLAAATASVAFLTGTIVAVKAVARMNRDGGVKSPGKPSMPLPAPNGASDTPSISCGLSPSGFRLV